MTSKGDEGVPGMASRRVRELRGLQQGLVHLQSSHPSMSLPPPSWHRRFLVLLDSGLLSFDPCASPGTPVCHIKARDVLGARFSLSDPSGCTLDVLIASPHGPATLHLYSSAARRWLQMLQDLFLRDCIDTEVWRSNDDNNIHPVCTKSSEILESSSQSIAEAQTMMPKSLEGDQRSSADIMLLEDRITNSGGMIALNQLESSTSFQRNQSAQRHLGGTEIEGQLVHSAFTKDESKLCAGIEVPEHRDRLIRDGRTASLNSERDQIEICRRFSSRLPVHCDAQVTEEKLSLVGIPGNSLHIHQDSSEESISGLTLTSDSSESQESSNLNEYNHEANSVNKYMLQEQVDDCDDEDAPLHSRIHSGEEVRRLNQVATTCHNVISKAKEDSCVLTYQKSIAEYDLYGSSEMMKMSSRFLKRSYLHIRINECWLNEAVLEESLQEGFKAPISFYNIIACLYHGGEKLAQSIELSTTFVLGCTNLRWNELLTFPILLVDLPQKEVRLNLALYRGALCGTDQVQSSMVGWTNFCFVNETGVLEIKKHLLRLWKDPPFYSCGTFAENTSEEFCGVLSVELDYNAYCTSLHQEDFVESDEDDDPPTPTDEEMDLLESITSISDVITPPTEAEKHVLWQLRHALVNNPHALPRFLMSVPWSTHRCVKETHRILEKWKPIQPFSALQLLGPQFGDKVVRSYAVERLRTISDDEFLLILIQVVQALVYEPYHKSSLLQLLLERASNWTIGHHLFWLFKAQN